MSRIARVLVLTWAAWACLAGSCGGQHLTWHSSQHDFQKLLDRDLELLSKIESLVAKDRSDTLESKTNVNDAKLLTEVRAEGIDVAYKHPVSQYRLLDAWRSVNDIPKLQIDQNMNLEGILKRASDMYPNESDRKTVLLNLYSIQKSRDLRAEDLAGGIVVGFQGSEMSVKDCEEMGRIALQQENKRLAVSWFREALKKFSRDRGIKDTNRELEMSNVRNNLESLSDDFTCEDLCKRDQEVVRIRKNLHCRMWDNFRHPWLVLQPVKMELLETDPHVYRFYDVISDDEIAELKDLSRPKLKEAKTAGNKHKTVDLNSVRVAHNCDFSGRNFKLVARLNKRIEDMTGLSMKEPVENLQVATYGIGGHYSVHLDADNVTQSFYNGRVATFMFYLSDVQYGGSTVFVEPGVAVRPRKGSALFWYNLLPSGYLDARTRHCACQILVGTKWIANQFIHQRKTGICRDLEGLGQTRS